MTLIDKRDRELLSFISTRGEVFFKELRIEYDGKRDIVQSLAQAEGNGISQESVQ